MNGTLVISLDFELLWGLAGWDESSIRTYMPHIKGAPFALEKILNILQQHDMKCTIAFVGGMMYSSFDEFCDSAPVIRPQYVDSIFSSYSSIVECAKGRWGVIGCPELLLKLRENPLVELATHTFSHYYCMEDGQNLVSFEADICTVKEETKRKLGLELKTIVFPRNQVTDAYLAICAKYGFTHYRGNLGTFLYRSESTPNPYSIRRILRGVDTYLGIFSKCP